MANNEPAYRMLERIVSTDVNTLVRAIEPAVFQVNRSKNIERGLLEQLAGGKSADYVVLSGPVAPEIKVAITRLDEYRYHIQIAYDPAQDNGNQRVSKAAFNMYQAILKRLGG